MGAQGTVRGIMFVVVCPTGKPYERQISEAQICKGLSKSLDSYTFREPGLQHSITDGAGPASFHQLLFLRWKVQSMTNRS